MGLETGPFECLSPCSNLNRNKRSCNPKPTEARCSLQLNPAAAFSLETASRMNKIWFPKCLWWGSTAESAQLARTNHRPIFGGNWPRRHGLVELCRCYKADGKSRHWLGSETSRSVSNGCSRHVNEFSDGWMQQEPFFHWTTSKQDLVETKLLKRGWSCVPDMPAPKRVSALHSSSYTFRVVSRHAWWCNGCRMSAKMAHFCATSATRLSYAYL